jgi:hypothetical protein
MSKDQAPNDELVCVGTVDRQYQGWVNWGDTSQNMPTNGTKIYAKKHDLDASVVGEPTTLDDELAMTIEMALVLLGEHPEVAQGNSKVHYVYHKLKRFAPQPVKR